ERWQRQGEPLRYSLGYYPGQRLWLALQQVIDTWTPPPAPKPKPVPKIVRLDSMSLFDSGKSVLKPGSTKMLVNSLVGIKARPGWLIVVSGHTDNTGSVQLNQTLSLQRAEAVRNWMRDTG
ncbi:OmpA family protein, partial [Klebsiella aerogenes]|uniref:OmpA family protein n=1 Tax=Klebsiella aerogenes TaxID=548 RepID=UPI001BCF58FB